MAVFTKPRFASLTAELLGTGVLTLVVLAAARATGGTGYFIAFAVGLVLAMLVITLGRVSGGHFNPAITLGLWTVRKVTTLRAVTYIAVQFIGAFLAYLLFTYLIGTELSTTPVDFKATMLVAEVLGTAILAFGVAAAVFGKFTPGAAAFTIGGGLAVGILLASTASAAFLNPAVALGGQSFELAIYVLGPVLGGILGINLYSLVFATSEKPSLKVKAAAVKPVDAPVAKSTSKATAAKKPAAKKAPAKKTTKK